MRLLDFVPWENVEKASETPLTKENLIPQQISVFKFSDNDDRDFRKYNIKRYIELDRDAFEKAIKDGRVLRQLKPRIQSTGQLSRTSSYSKRAYDQAYQQYRQKVGELQAFQKEESTRLHTRLLVSQQKLLQMKVALEQEILLELFQKASNTPKEK